MGFIGNFNDRLIIRQAYYGTKKADGEKALRKYDATLRRIGREAAREGISLAEAYERWDELREGLDDGHEEEVDSEGEDPGLEEEISIEESGDTAVSFDPNEEYDDDDTGV